MEDDDSYVLMRRKLRDWSSSGKKIPKYKWACGRHFAYWLFEGRFLSYHECDENVHTEDYRMSKQYGDKMAAIAGPHGWACLQVMLIQRRKADEAKLRSARRKKNRVTIETARL